MKRYWLFLSILALVSLGLGKEYLVKIATPSPNDVSRLLAANIKVVTEMKGFALTIATDEELKKL